jgi:hypothetical protein
VRENFISQKKDFSIKEKFLITGQVVREKKVNLKEILTPVFLSAVFCVLIFCSVFLVSNSSDKIITNSVSIASLQGKINDAAGLLKEYGKWFAATVKNKFANIGSEKISQKNTEENTSSEEAIASQGIVVVPSEGDDESTKKKIEKYFSDEVKVESEDENSGVIVPVFKSGREEKYLYMMIPMQN